MQCYIPFLINYFYTPPVLKRVIFKLERTYQRSMRANFVYLYAYFHKNETVYELMHKILVRALSVTRYSKYIMIHLK